MQLAVQKELVDPPGRQGGEEGGRLMRGGLTGTQVERDEEKLTETLRLVTPCLIEGGNDRLL